MRVRSRHIDRRMRYIKNVRSMPDIVRFSRIISHQTIRQLFSMRHKVGNYIIILCLMIHNSAICMSVSHCR